MKETFTIAPYALRWLSAPVATVVAIILLGDLILVRVLVRPRFNSHDAVRWLGPFPLISIAAILFFDLFIVLVLFVWPRYLSHHVRFELDSSGFAIKGDMYGRTIPWRELDVSKARTLNLKEQTEFALKWRTNGNGLPGYSSGWFKLADGEKALAFVTDRTHVVYVPTRDGYAVMLSVADPGAFLRSLQRAAA
jgi:hypothetical protein